MDGVEAHSGDFVGAMGHGPLTTLCHDCAVVSLITAGQLAIGQVGQVVNDVFRYGLTVAVCRHCYPCTPMP